MARKTILAIDDNRVILEAINSCLSEYYNVIIANDGHEGFELAEAQIPDIILLDIMMPGLDGFSTLMLLKQTDTTKDIPVIMLTAVGKKDKVLAAFRDGASAYLLKPFKPDTLLQKIENVLVMHEAELSNEPETGTEIIEPETGSE